VSGVLGPGTNALAGKGKPSQGAGFGWLSLAANCGI
jgi:hypothetical protein